MKKLRQKRPRLAEQGFVFHWDNTPVHTAAVIQKWFTAKAIQRLENPPYSPDLVPSGLLFVPLREGGPGWAYFHR